MVGGGSDIFDEVVEDVTHLRGLEVASHSAVHGAEEVELGELRQAVELGELLRGIQPLLEIAAVDEVVEVGRILEEALHVRAVLPDLGGLPGHDFGVGVEVDVAAVFEEIPPVRAQRADRDVVAHFAAGLFEEPLEKVGQGEDRGPEVESVAVEGQHVELAADLVVLFVDRDPVALLGE